MYFTTLRIAGNCISRGAREADDNEIWLFPRDHAIAFHENFTGRGHRPLEMWCNVDHSFYNHEEQPVLFFRTQELVPISAL